MYLICQDVFIHYVCAIYYGMGKKQEADGDSERGVASENVMCQLEWVGMGYMMCDEGRQCDGVELKWEDRDGWEMEDGEGRIDWGSSYT